MVKILLSFFFSGSVVFRACFLAVGVVLAFITRKMPVEFNWSKEIAMAIYTMAIILGIGIPLGFALSGSATMVSTFLKKKKKLRMFISPPPPSQIQLFYAEKKSPYSGVCFFFPVWGPPEWCGRVWGFFLLAHVRLLTVFLQVVMLKGLTISIAYMTVTTIVHFDSLKRMFVGKNARELTKTSHGVSRMSKAGTSRTGTTTDDTTT